MRDVGRRGDGALGRPGLQHGVHVGEQRRAAVLGRQPGEGSTTAETTEPPSSAVARMCRRPICPAPITAIRTRFALIACTSQTRFRGPFGFAGTRSMGARSPRPTRSVRAIAAIVLTVPSRFPALVVACGEPRFGAGRRGDVGGVLRRLAQRVVVGARKHHHLGPVRRDEALHLSHSASRYL